jgi:hypothetical protein
MFGKSVFAVTLLAATVACAQPNYQDDVAPAADQKPAATCALAYVNGLCVDITWEVQPTEDAAGSFLLKFYSAATPEAALDPQAKVTVVLWMPGMGHGSSPVTVTPVSPGVYRATNVYFVMPGDWEIRIKLKNDKNETAEVVQAISI